MRGRTGFRETGRKGERERRKGEGERREGEGERREGRKERREGRKDKRGGEKGRTGGKRKKGTPCPPRRGTLKDKGPPFETTENLNLEGICVK